MERAGASSLGSHSSHRGRYQFQSPSSFIVAGSSTARTTVASTAIAIASPRPICLNWSRVRLAKTPKTPTITAAALVTEGAVALMPCRTASSVDSPASTSSLIRLTMNTW